MGIHFVAVILIVGIGGIVAQVLLLRELLVSFYGNELIIGIILANWLVTEGLGAFLLGRYIDRARNKITVFVIVQSVFALMLPLSIYLARICKGMFGILPGETVGLAAVIAISFLIVGPVSFCHGALFSLSCNIYNSIGGVYAWETMGTLVGGAFLTYCLIPFLNSFQIVTLLSALTIAVCVALSNGKRRLFRYLAVILIFIAAWPLIGRNLERRSIARQWRKYSVLDYRNSVYGNIVVTQREGQYTFFYNGIPIVVVPHPDLLFTQEFGNLPLLFHPHPGNVLVVSGGAGGLINEILKSPVKRVDYMELDPLIIRMLKEYPTALTQRELNDPRVRVINQDGRFFLRTVPYRYDCVLIGVSNPAELSTNRFLTQEFFALAKTKLIDGGILAFCLPGSSAYLSRQLRDLNACILNGLKNTYCYVRIIPGDYNMFLASDARGITEVDPALLSERLSQRNIKPDILVPAYLNYRLDKKRLAWFEASMSGATSHVNRDNAPFAVFETLVLWNKQFSVLTSKFFEFFEDTRVECYAFSIFAFTVVLFLLFYRRPGFLKAGIAYSIATTGFFGMLMSLVLIFSYQVHYGYLYHRIGVLISIFMAGTALGSVAVTKAAPRIKNDISLFLTFEAAIILFTGAVGLVLNSLAQHARYLSLLFAVLFFIAGFLVGIEFPLAGKIHLQRQSRVGKTSGWLYFCDLAGGWGAGIFGGVVILPILGIFNTCMVMALFKLSSLLLLGTVLTPFFSLQKR